MSVNSIRENIILQIRTELETLESIKTVRRIRPSLNELSSFPSTQLPLIAVESGLPSPIQKKSSRIPGVTDNFISELIINIFCYALENVNPDSLISNLADDIWNVLYLDPLHNNLCLSTNIYPQLQTAIWHPYIAFSFKTTLTYIHTRKGI